MDGLHLPAQILGPEEVHCELKQAIWYFIVDTQVSGCVEPPTEAQAPKSFQKRKLDFRQRQKH